LASDGLDAVVEQGAFGFSLLGPFHRIVWWHEIVNDNVATAVRDAFWMSILVFLGTSDAHQIFVVTNSLTLLPTHSPLLPLPTGQTIAHRCATLRTGNLG